MTTFFAPERHQHARFVLRSYLPGDGPLLARTLNASYEHLRRFMPWAQPQTEERDAELRVRANRARWLLNEDFVIAILSPDERELYGGCGYHLRHGGLEQRVAEIGMFIGAPYAGQGLGSAVLRELLRWGFAAWPWLRLSWHCSAANLASQRLAEKAGMQREGTLRSVGFDPGGVRRDTVVFAALKDRWPATDQER